MLATNNDKVGRWLIYKVNGEAKKVQIPGLTTVNLPDLNSEAQVIKNQFDLKVSRINSLLNRRLTGDFSFSQATTEIQPSALILDWYTALSVKPSDELLSSLNTLVDGMDADGDLVEMDFLAITAGMETEEQALRPLKTTGSATMTKGSATPESGLTWTVSGYAGNNDGYILSNYNPLTNGTKYTLNSVCMASFVSVSVVTSSGNGNFMGGGSTPDGIQDSETFTQATWNNTSITAPTSQYLPNTNVTQTPRTVSQTVGVGASIFIGNVRSASTVSYNWINNQRSATKSNTPNYVPNVNFGYFGVSYYDESTLDFLVSPPTNRVYSKCGIVGSGNIGLERVGSRLNTFFESRGLSVYI